jgi:ferredoxin
MTQTMRKTIRIDEDKCVGCEQCVQACQQGALAIVDGKAKLVDKDHCDGLGICIGECPFGAIQFIDEPVETGGNSNLNVIEQPSPPSSGGCPGQSNQMLQKLPNSVAEDTPSAGAESALNAWPIQLHLVQPTASQFQGADVLIAATCSAFAQGGFHQDLLRGRSLVIACPKLDRQEGYDEKLVRLFRESSPRSVTIARMEVPCCRGLTAQVRRARDVAESETPVEEVTISLRGEVLSRKEI